MGQRSAAPFLWLGLMLSERESILALSDNNVGERFARNDGAAPSPVLDVTNLIHVFSEGVIPKPCNSRALLCLPILSARLRDLLRCGFAEAMFKFRTPRALIESCRRRKDLKISGNSAGKRVPTIARRDECCAIPNSSAQEKAAVRAAFSPPF
jgi:hypothetical protein